MSVDSVVNVNIVDIANTVNIVNSVDIVKIVKIVNIVNIVNIGDTLKFFRDILRWNLAHLLHTIFCIFFGLLVNLLNWMTLL